VPSLLKRIGLLAPVAAGAFVLGAIPASAAEVRVVVSYYSDKTGPLFEQAAREFEEQNPDIDVTIEVVNWDTLNQKLTTDIAGGSAPDISIIGTRWLVDFVENDLVEPLDDYMSEEFRDRFIDVFLEPSVLDGQLYGLPVAASARALYYNTELLERASVDGPPEAWEDLEEAAKKIAALDDNTYGFGVQGKEVETDAYYYYALWTFGGDLVTEDGRSGLRSPEAIEAAEFYKHLIDEGATQPGVTAYNREDMQDLFKQGRLGMLITGPWLRGQLAEEAPDLDYGVAMIPEGSTRATYGVTDSIVMFSESDVKDEAWRFMEFIFRPEFRTEFSKAEGFLPVLKSVAEDPHFQQDERLAAFTEMLPDAKFAPTIAGWEEIADITSRALQRIYLGEQQPEQALTAAADEIDQILAR
jgi:multiple sugar transport system substrate-binding protein